MGDTVGEQVKVMISNPGRSNLKDRRVVPAKQLWTTVHFASL